MEEPQMKDLDEWVSKIRGKGGELGKLGGNFRYLMQNEERLIEGELDSEEFPHFGMMENYGIMLGNSLGATIIQENTRIVERSDRLELVKQDNLDNNFSGTVYEPDIELTSDDMIEKAYNNSEVLGDALRKAKDFMIEEVSIDDLEFDSLLESVVVYSTLFGAIWETDSPSLYVKLDEDDKVEKFGEMEAKMSGGKRLKEVFSYH